MADVGTEKLTQSIFDQVQYGSYCVNTLIDISELIASTSELLSKVQGYYQFKMYIVLFVFHFSFF